MILHCREGVDVVEVDIVDVVAGAVDSAVVGVDVGDSDGVHQRESIRRMLPAMESRHRRKPTLKMERVDEVVVGVVEVVSTSSLHCFFFFVRRLNEHCCLKGKGLRCARPSFGCFGWGRHRVYVASDSPCSYDSSLTRVPGCFLPLVILYSCQAVLYSSSDF